MDAIRPSGSDQISKPIVRTTNADAKANTNKDLEKLGIAGAATLAISEIEVEADLATMRDS